MSFYRVGKATNNLSLIHKECILDKDIFIYLTSFFVKYQSHIPRNQQEENRCYWVAHLVP
ncbi:MAG: hypothetical protein CVU51_02030 [Deltaproteobacteria bacterium HGW-Deltaproteobacteria-1]|nr:MAG: hypothetical protein CVU51_02030 [Deltaproteobacteria bacterium HGW-Deltaproteobacteria-1]